MMHVFGGGAELVDPGRLAFRALTDFLERGIDFFDTAESYGPLSVRILIV